MQRKNTITELKGVIKELQIISEQAKAKYEEAENKINHIKAVLNILEYKSTKTPTKGPNHRKTMSVKEAIIKALKDAEKKMTIREIYRDVLIKKGVKCTKGTFNVNINRLVNDNNSNIKRVKTGIYKYEN